jgi:hypothetical protein
LEERFVPSSSEDLNRKLHTYLGVFFLFFIWLFSLSGVVLNHPKWRISDFWGDRKETLQEGPIAARMAPDDLTQAKIIVEQLGLRGEISGLIRHDDSKIMMFQVVRPGDIYQIKADFANLSAQMKHIRVNGWGVLNMLHSFTGVRRSDPSLRQTWWATRIWRFLMDALAVGLIFMVLSGIYLWYVRGRWRRTGSMVLVLGILIVAAILSA